MRIGHGYDAHRFAEGEFCTLCGVRIYCGYGLKGHSDADVPVHALMDAMLGAAALGDIGRHFPDSDPKYRGADSMGLLRQVDSMLRDKGYTVVNADVTIVAQKPRVVKHIEEMRRNLAEAMGIDEDCVNVKATTEEGMGFTGEELGLAAHAVVLID